MYTDRIKNSSEAKEGEPTAEKRLVDQKKKEKDEANCWELAKEL